MAPRPATPPPRPTTIVLVRHGETTSTGKVLPGRAPGLHLSDRGRDQALHAAQRLKTLRAVHALYVSPLERTRETAAPIAAALGLRARRCAGLIECDFGSWTGRRLSELRKLADWHAVQHAPSTFRFPQGESFAEMQQRIVGQLDALAARHPGETVVCVSHADPIKAAVTHAQGVHLDLFQRTVISPCSLSILVRHGGGSIALAVNSTGDDLSGLVAS